MDQDKIEQTADRATRLLRQNRFTAFLQLLTPLMVIIAFGFTMFLVAVVGVLVLTVNFIYSSFVNGNLLYLTGGLVLFGLEGLAISLGSYSVLGGN